MYEKLEINSKIIKETRTRDQAMSSLQMYINPQDAPMNQKEIKVLCEQTRELTDDLYDFLDYV